LTQSRGIGRSGIVLVLAAVFLAAGVAVDLGFTKPARESFKRLSAQRDELVVRSARALEQQADNQELARRLNLGGLSELIAVRPQSDPLNYLGRTIEASGLTRLDLSSGNVSLTANLRQTRFTLRLLGTYSSLLRFTRSLEQGPRLASIEAFSIQEIPESRQLEFRLQVSIHEPILRQEP